jgi:nucleoside-diphosphate-sugar epimerase
MGVETSANKVLLTGGAGFFGEILKETLLKEGVRCVSLDFEADSTSHPNLISVRGDIRDKSLLQRLFAEHRFGGVFHCAAVLAHASPDRDFLWSSNVEGTRNLAEAARACGTRKFIFISSNCLWAENFHRPVREDDPPRPAEIYGQSKWEAEKVLAGFSDSLQVVILRTPTIMDCGRLGLLAILYEFIADGKKVWVVGGGKNRYQFMYAGDLADACLRAYRSDVSGVFNVGSDDVKTFREVYQYVIDRANTGSRVASLPKVLILPVMRLLYRMGLSPLGPYQYKMIAEDFEFDTSKIKRELGWKPTLTNEEVLWKAYEYYAANREEIQRRTDVSAHKKPASMGAIALLKWLS